MRRLDTQALRLTSFAVLNLHSYTTLRLYLQPSVKAGLEVTYVTHGHHGASGFSLHDHARRYLRRDFGIYQGRIRVFLQYQLRLAHAHRHQTLDSAITLSGRRQHPFSKYRSLSDVRWYR